jgi:hypothetical protein
MRLFFIAAIPFLVAVLPAFAQDTPPSPPSAGDQHDPTSDANHAKLKSRIEAGRKKQEAANAKTTGLWTRWTYAVCIGCGVGEPKNIRVVHTTPERVLAGYPAAEDDARELAAGRARRL